MGEIWKRVDLGVGGWMDGWMDIDYLVLWLVRLGCLYIDINRVQKGEQIDVLTSARKGKEKLERSCWSGESFWWDETAFSFWSEKLNSILTPANVTFQFAKHSHLSSFLDTVHRTHGFRYISFDEPQFETVPSSMTKSYRYTPISLAYSLSRGWCLCTLTLLMRKKGLDWDRASVDHWRETKSGRSEIKLETLCSTLTFDEKATYPESTVPKIDLLMIRTVWWKTNPEFCFG